MVSSPIARDAVEPDAELLLEWRNDPQTRVVSRSTGVITLERHLEWLRGALASADRVLLVVELDDEPVGTVRFDREPGDASSWEVSITIAPKHRGHGLSGAILAAGERRLTERHRAARILADVHEDNAASAALFRSAGYVETLPAGEFRHLCKTLR
jgi:RimJ/RimL family protein N-acetyltransferase